MKRRLQSVAIMLLTMLGFAMQASAQEAPTLTQKWKLTEGLPPVNESRQMTVVDGKIYIQNKLDSKIEIWDANGKSTTSLDSGKGTNITRDEAGNIIVRVTAFPGIYADGDLIKVFPVDGGTPVEIALSGLPAARGDFFGEVQGNILDSETGGRMYITANSVASVTVVPIIGGVQDVDNTVPYPLTSVVPEGLTTIQAISENEAVITRRSTGNPAITKLVFDFGAETMDDSFKYVTPSRNASAGSFVFTMGGVDYIIYATSATVAYKDGFAIAKATDDAENAKIVEHAEESVSVANGFQSNWVKAEVVSATKANIYQYYPGGFIAMYEFEVPAAEKPLYMIGQIDKTDYAWAANVGHKMIMGEDGIYTASVKIAENATVDGIGAFGFATKLGADKDDWATLNANRYGAPVDGTMLEEGVETPLVKADMAFKMEAWTYDVTVDMNKMTVMCVANPAFPEPVKTELVQKWKLTEGLPPVAESRQMTVVDGKIYIQNKLDSKIEIWDANGKSATSLDSGKGTNITRDEAGNIIVRVTAFPGGYADGDLIKVFPVDGGTPVEIALSGLPAARGDYFGEVQGNILDTETGGRMYITATTAAGGAGSLTVVPIIGGVQDADNTLSYPLTSFTSDGMTTIQAISENEAVITRRSTGNPAITKLVFDFGAETMDDSFKYVTPSRNASAGSFVFTMGGVDYIIYATSATVAYKDGFAIAKATDDAGNAKIVEHAEESLSVANSFQSNWVKAEVVSATKANIYQYYPGGFIAMYEFTAPEPAPAPEPLPANLYVIGDLEGGAWDPSNASIALVPSTDEEGVYVGDIMPKAGGDTTKPNVGFFAISSALGSNSDDWTPFNANRFGPEVDNTILEKNAESFIGKHNTAFGIEVSVNGYTLKVNILTGKIIANQTISVDKVEAAEYKVVAGYGEINVIGDVNQVDVYTMSGALLQSGKTEIQCAAGIYIVRVDGKAHKVIVK